MSENTEVEVIAAPKVYKKISELFGVKAPDAAVIEVRAKTHFVPDLEHHVFDAAVLKKLLMWMQPKTPVHNIMLIGGKGVGKTSLILQFAARLGIPVASISCSGKVRVADMIGTLVIQEDGSTKFVDGPLTTMYRNGGIFLANELTRMDIGEQMRLVDVLDRQSRLTIPQTGEILVRHPDFRFAGTGNSGGHGDESGAYAGEKIGSSAFLDRFLKLELSAMSEADEVSLITSIIGGAELGKSMVTFARALREQYIGTGNAGASCEIDISPRATIAWAQVAVEYKKMSNTTSLKEALHDVVLNGSPKDSKEAVLTMYEKFFKIS